MTDFNSPASMRSFRKIKSSAFASANLDMLAERALLRRTDTKFLLPRRRLGDLLAQLPHWYSLVRVEGQACAHYMTQYFDTPEFAFFHDHRRGRKPRRKVRYRHYMDRRLSYLEVEDGDPDD